MLRSVHYRPLRCPECYPEALAKVADILFQRLLSCFPADNAKVLALRMVDDLQSQFPGESIYIPMRNLEQRNAAIWRDFTGSNHAELARLYQLSLSTIYDIVAEQRRLQASGG
ncbi:MAG: Mor transcription activator family protein [Candidatus Contendobacter sp.]